MSPKQLANLKPIKKGQILNPNGGKAHNPLVRAISSYTNNIFAEVLQAVLTADSKTLHAMTLPGPNSNSLRMLVARAMEKAVKDADYSFVERIADRMIGRIPDVNKVDVNTHTRNENLTVTEAMIQLAIQKAEENV